MAMHSRIHQHQSKKSDSTEARDPLQSRPFPKPMQPKPEQALPDLQTMVENASRFGHHLRDYMSSAPASTRLPIQPKLTIGAPGDKYEQEADRVARQVVQQLHAPTLGRSQPDTAIQRETLPEEDEELQMKPSGEQIQRVELPEEDEELQMKPLTNRIQKVEVPEEEDALLMKSTELRLTNAAMTASGEFEGAIAQARGGGQPLAETIRQPMEQSFGADFSGVRVHTDSQSDRLNRSIQARAFTTGQDVFFRQGAYQPGNRGGQELLAHELTHVVQQSNTQFQLLTPNICQSYVQARLMDVATFENLKDQAANRKSLNRKHSSKDYQKLYKKYNQAFNNHQVKKAYEILQSIDAKVDRMRQKLYWKSNNDRNTFLQQVTNGVEEERLLLDKLSIERNVGNAFEESGSFRPHGILTFTTGSEEDKTYHLGKQRHDLVIEVLKTIREQVPAAKDQIMAPQLIQTLDQNLPTPTTYVDVYNQISQTLQAFAPRTRAQLIQQINNNGALNVRERVVEIAKVLWGDFTWETEGSNDFREWARGQNNNPRGPNATMNCWEVVLEVLLQAGVVTQQQVRQTYMNRAQMGEAAYFASLRNLLGWTNAAAHLAYSQGDYTNNHPPTGSVIFYERDRPPDQMGNTLEHVVISLGQSQNGITEVMSLWNKDTGGKLGKTTMDSLLGQAIKYISFS